MAYPVCPKCGDENWSVSVNHDVKDTTLVNMALKNKDPNWMKILESSPSYVVLFVYCNSCGHTLTGQVLKQNAEQ